MTGIEREKKKKGKKKKEEKNKTKTKKHPTTTKLTGRDRDSESSLKMADGRSELKKLIKRLVDEAVAPAQCATHLVVVHNARRSVLSGFCVSALPAIPWLSGSCPANPPFPASTQPPGLAAAGSIKRTNGQGGSSVACKGSLVLVAKSDIGK